MSPQDAADRFTEIATLLEVRGENPFKARAFQQAARSLLGLSEPDIAPLVSSGAMARLPGIGQTTLGVLRDLVETGDSAYLDQLRETTPEGLVEMLRIPGVGPTRVHRIHSGLGIETVADLEAAARDGRLAGLGGFGPKTAARILRGIATLRETSGQLLHSLALAEALRMRAALGRLPGVDRVELAGALRRSLEVVRDVDLVVGADEPASVAVAAATIPGVDAVMGTGRSATLRLGSGVRVDLACVARDRAGVALWLATGSRAHCDAVRERAIARGYAIRDDQLLAPDGRAVEGADEAAIYRAAALPWIAPELRESLGEVEAAAAGTLPVLVEMEDIRGVLHCHSDYSDGTTSILALALAARGRGWSYLGVSDHSQSAIYAGGLDRDAVLRQHDEIDRLNGQLGSFRILKGIEADILADGTIDYPPDLLDRFDYVIASVHSRFSMNERQMTDRILRALDDPHVTILGHPTGRLLLAREPYPVDVEAVITRAAQLGVAVELNCDPHRLDLDWRWLQVARARGAMVELGPDAHSPDGFSYLDLGVGIARKGWLGADNVLNAGDAGSVLEFARRRRAATAGPR